MLEIQSNFIEAARKAGVKHIVKLSGIIAELDSPFRYARMHGEIERLLEASAWPLHICALANSSRRTFGSVVNRCQGFDDAADGRRAHRVH